MLRISIQLEKGSLYDIIDEGESLIILAKKKKEKRSKIRCSKGGGRTFFSYSHFYSSQRNVRKLSVIYT